MIERAKKIVQDFRTKKSTFTEQNLINILREYLQVLILKFIYQSKHGASLSFMGGTCLRICYDLKRYSEDLDFAFDDKKQSYRFSNLMRDLERRLTLSGFTVEHLEHEDKTVQKGFLRFSNIAKTFDFKSFRNDQKLHIKLEVDTNPIPLKRRERESFFVNRFQEIFPILKHNLPTLFAGKILAILQRPYDRGRDYYDLIWYLSQNASLNVNYLNRGFSKKKFKNNQEVFFAVKEKISQIKPQILLKDINRFLEDPNETSWILRFEELYDQLIQAYHPKSK